MDKYTTLASGSLAIEKMDYDALETSGLCKVSGQPNGVQLEVFDVSTGKIVKYAESINNLWFER